MDPFEASFKEWEHYSSDDKTRETQSTTSDASEVLTMSSRFNGEEEDQEEDENVDVVIQNILTSANSESSILAKTKAIMSQLTDEQMARYEYFRRSRFKKAEMRRLLQGITGTKTISEPLIIAVSAATKLFVGDIIETTRTAITERKDLGAIRPGHIREAYRRLKLEGKVPRRSFRRLFL